MDYEIDIEEHDVLDNPAVKEIFPDISVIKKEITQYYEEEPTIKEEQEVAEIQTPQLSTADDVKLNIGVSNYQNDTSVKPHSHTNIENEKSQPIQSNKIILGSRPKSVTQDTSQKLILGSKSNILKQHDSRNHITSSRFSYTQDEINKKLILGSKSNTVTHIDNKKIEKITHEKVKVKHMKLVLQDIKSYLNQNGRYCKLCCRLFLSKKALDIHISKEHCDKIPYKNKQIVKKADVAEARHKCRICNSYFANNSNLCRHYKSIHKTNKNIMSKKICNSGYKISKKIGNSGHKCNICNMKFSSKASLKRHNGRRKHTKNLKLNALKNIKEIHNVSTGKENRRVSLAKKHCGTASGRKIRKGISIRKNPIPIVKSDDKDHEHTLIATSKLTQKVSNNKESVQITSSAQNLEVTLIEEAIRPKYVTRAKTPSTKDSNLCLHCKIVFPDQKSLIEHMYEILEPKRNSSELINNTSSVSKNEVDKVLCYVCRQCSYYLQSVKSYFTHMSRNHKTESFLEVKKEKFDALCKYCPFMSTSIAIHNKHIHSYHNELMFLRIENEIENAKNNQRKCSENMDDNVIIEFSSFALESVLFECNKCNICFLSSNIARNHKQHTMKMIDNWKCSICSLILKEENKEMHLKQHLLSQPLKVHNINETAIYNVLYNCTKCAIHFTEKRYQQHYPNCESDATDSSYCGTCDILIDKMDMIHHKTQHEDSRDISDFTIVESNIIVNTATGLKRKGTNIVSEAKPKKRLYEQHNCLTYCSTCKSFLSDSGLKNKNHIKRTCANLLTYPCTECGLIFTSSTLQIHKERHEKEKNFRLQDYKFFDLQGIQVLPPIPKYPHCKTCNIHFLRKNDISGHICYETIFLTCDICNIKLSENTYKLHMSFHFYVLRKTSFQNDSTSDLPTNSNVTNVNNQTSELLKISTEFESKTQMKSELTKTSMKPEEELLHRKSKSKLLGTKPADILPTTPENNNESDLVEEQMSNDDSVFILYTCKTCSVTIESYDEVLKHCHSHYNTRKNQITSMKTCRLCLLKIDSRSYLDHVRKVHSSVSKTQFLTFDPIYFTSKNMIWVKHIFQTLPEEMVKELLKKTIYQHEHRIQLECIQRGSSPILVYKCDSCGNFIDPGCVYRHAENPCAQVRKHPCSFCGLPYISIISRNSHEKLHKQIKGLTKKSLNIILFNQSKDKTLNGRIFRTSNEYTLYQCRNCHRVVEKSMLTDHVCVRNSLVKCITCGLLISKEDFKAHLSKHTDLGNFCSENFKVILFGLKNSNTSNKEAFKKLSPCFNGMIYDYTLYKCQICEMCLKNNESTEKHICISNFDLDRSMCSECDLYFPSGNLRHHIKQHRIDRDFVKENINVITFNNTSLKANESFSCSINKHKKIIRVEETQNEMDGVIDENVTKITKVYNGKEKGVNDSEKTTTKTTNSGYGISVFSNKEINEHYLIKNVDNDYEIGKQNENDILNTDKKEEANTDEYNTLCDDNVYLKNENNVDSDVEKIIAINGNDVIGIHDGESLTGKIKKNYKNKNIDIGMDNVDGEHGTLYKCKCGLHFLNEQKVTEHIKKCQPKAKQSKQNCSKCNLLFNPSELFSHLVVHHGDKTHVHKFKVVEISRNS